MSLEELDDMVRVTNECGVKFTVHHQRRLDQDFRIMKEIFDQKALGDVYMMKTVSMDLMEICMTGMFT